MIIPVVLVLGGFSCNQSSVPSWQGELGGALEHRYMGRFLGNFWNGLNT